MKRRVICANCNMIWDYVERNSSITEVLKEQIGCPRCGSNAYDVIVRDNNVKKRLDELSKDL